MPAVVPRDLLAMWAHSENPTVGQLSPCTIVGLEPDGTSAQSCRIVSAHPWITSRDGHTIPIRPYLEPSLDQTIIDTILTIACDQGGDPWDLDGLFMPKASGIPRMSGGGTPSMIIATHATLARLRRRQEDFRRSLDFHDRTTFDAAHKLGLEPNDYFGRILGDDRVVVLANPGQLGLLIIQSERVYERGVPIAGGFYTPNRFEYHAGIIISHGGIQLFGARATPSLTYRERLEADDEQVFPVGKVPVTWLGERLGRTAWDHVMERDAVSTAADSMRAFAGIGERRTRTLEFTEPEDGSVKRFEWPRKKS